MTAEGPHEGNPKKDAAPLDGKQCTVAGVENSGEGYETKNDGLPI